MNRNYSDPEYKKARAAARKRDGYKCRICNSKIKLQVHHVKKYADYPILRNTVDNLITLCKRHHRSMWGNEEGFESYCYNLIHNVSSVYKMLNDFEKENGKENKEE